MKKIGLISIVFLCVVQFCAIAQKINIDKDGLVEVDGKNQFYLVKKNAVFGIGDFSWQNLNHEEIGFLKFGNSNSPNGSASNYLLVMTASASSAIISNFSSLSYHKSLARTLFNSEMLRADGTVDHLKERTFVISYFGRFYEMPNAVNNHTDNTNSNSTLDPANHQPSNAAPSLILKNNKIFFNKKLLGTYALKVVDKNTLVTISNTETKEMIIANYTQGNDEWELQNKINNTNIKVFYNELEPLQDLIQYCIQEKILQP
jgi:hypothetical protein